MKEFIEYIWNVPMIVAIVGVVVLLIAPISFLILVAVGLFKANREFNRMDKDFDAMRTRVRSRLRK